VAFAYVTIDDVELEDFKNRLGAVLDTYRGRTSTGSDIDTLQLTRSLDCEDLAGVPDFQTYTSGYEPASVDFVFNYPTVGDVRVRISTVNGSVWFKKGVPEEIIDHVYQVMREVKGIP
jgi:hypothetical protein